jgi:hypothetical protein
MLKSLRYDRHVIGFHGCDRSVGERALLHGDALWPSDNPYDWLGRGIYFWEHGPTRALQWAQDAQRRGRIAEPFVLGAFIQLGRCLDLADAAASRLVAGWHQALKSTNVAAGHPMPVNRPLHPRDDDRILRDLDCAVLNMGLSRMERLEPAQAFQTVRGIFTEGGPAFEGSGIQMHSHVQIAVRDPDCIVGYFRLPQ